MPRGKLTGTRVSGAILLKPTDQIGAMAAGHPCRRPAGGAAPKPPPSLTGMAPKGFGWFACENKCTSYMWNVALLLSEVVTFPTTIPKL